MINLILPGMALLSQFNRFPETYSFFCRLDKEPVAIDDIVILSLMNGIFS